MTLELVISALLGILAFLGASLWYGQRDVVKELRSCVTSLALLAQRLDGHIEGMVAWTQQIERRLEKLESRPPP